jgi:predicted transposase YbfD/YdcC
MEEFAAIFADLEDPRTGNAGLHDLLEILMIALCTVLCGGQTAVDMAEFGEAKEAFLRKFLKLEHGIPSHDTFSRVFRALDPEQFRACFQRFMERFAAACRGVVAIDGKVLRRSFDKASGRSALHMVSAWGCEQRLVLGQIAVDAKSNEITAIPKLLTLLSLKGTIVTVDALNCQREIAQRIRERGADYALALKGNQGTLHADVTEFLADPVALAAADSHTETDGGHGRIEQRTAVVSTDIGWLQERHDWPGLAAIGKVIRRREIDGKVTTETGYYLLSAPFSPARFGTVVRAHWCIENQLHWTLDVTLNEDQSRTRKDNGPYNLAILRHMALNLIQKEPSRGSNRVKFKRAGWNDDFLAKLLAQN